MEDGQHGQLEQRANEKKVPVDKEPREPGNEFSHSHTSLQTTDIPLDMPLEIFIQRQGVGSLEKDLKFQQG